MKKQKESDLVRACLAYLSVYMKDAVWRNNSGGTKTASGGFIKFGLTGSPDIMGILPDGKFLGVECKIGKNVQSPGQLKFEEMVQRNSGEYWLIYAITELIERFRPYENSYRR